MMAAPPETALALLAQLSAEFDRLSAKLLRLEEENAMLRSSGPDATCRTATANSCREPVRQPPAQDKLEWPVKGRTEFDETIDSDEVSPVRSPLKSPRKKSPVRSPSSSRPLWSRGTTNLSVGDLEDDHQCVSIHEEVRAKRNNLDARQRIRNFVACGTFDLSVALLIVANTLIMAAEVQYLGFDSGYALSYPGYTHTAEQLWPGAPVVFEVLERIFVSLFTLEVMLKLIVFGCSFLKEALNWIDLITVAFGIADWLLSSYVRVNPLVMRLLRLAKLARGVRLVKLATIIEPLHFLLKCIGASISTLSWSLCMLIIVQCIAGMIISQLVQDFIMDRDVDQSSRHLVFKYYGTFSRAMITMFEIHFANFAPACRVLLDNLGEVYTYVFIAYRCILGWAVLNVINAVFIQQTLKVAQNDHDVMLLQKEKHAKRYSKEAQQMFKALDLSGRGAVSWEEFCTRLDDPKLKAWMSCLEIDVHDMYEVFSLMDVDGNGELSAHELIKGAERIKGPGRSIDIMYLMVQCRKMEALLEEKSDRARCSCSAAAEAMSPGQFRSAAAAA